MIVDTTAFVMILVDVVVDAGALMQSHAAVSVAFGIAVSEASAIDGVHCLRLKRATEAAAGAT